MKLSLTFVIMIFNMIISNYNSAKGWVISPRCHLSRESPPRLRGGGVCVVCLCVREEGRGKCEGAGAGGRGDFVFAMQQQ
jgi:hypothetical protein